MSPCGPPTTKRPVGLMWNFVLSSRRAAGTTGRMISSRIASRSSGVGIDSACCVEMTTASTRTGRSPSYSTVTWLLPSGRSHSRVLRLAGLGEAHRQLVRERDRKGHELFGLAHGKPEHEALVARAARVDAHRDVRRLLVDRREDGARLVVESVLRARVADVADRLPHDAGDVHVRLRRDLARDEREARRDQRLAGHAPDRVVLEDRVEDRVRDLVGDLVRMAFGDRFRREKTVVLAHVSTLQSRAAAKRGV